LNKDLINVKNESSTAVLAVDDEYDIVNLIKQSLQKVGQVKVCPFIDPPSALNHFKSDSKDHQDDVVISDIRMPGMNGYEFIKQVKNINSQVKVILMSAFEIQEGEFQNMLPDIKVDCFLQKPFHIQQLKEAMAKISTRS
jgi:two-component SAPR family response regulator